MDQVKGVLTVQGEALTQAVCLTPSWKWNQLSAKMALFWFWYINWTF